MPNSTHATALYSDSTPARPSVRAATPAQNDSPDAPEAANDLTLRTRTAQRLEVIFSAASQVSLPDAMRERYRSLLSDADAAELGRRLRTNAVLADVSNLPMPVVRQVLSRGLPGFGPTQLRYMLDLSRALLLRDDDRRNARVALALNSESANVPRAGVLRAYNLLYMQVDGLLTPDDPERAALKVVKVDDQTFDAVVHALNDLVRVATALIDRAAEDEGLQMVLDDNGLTRDSIADLLAPLALTREVTLNQRGALVDPESIDVLEGRIVDQLKRLRRVVAEVRKSQSTLAEVALPRSVPQRKPKAKDAKRSDLGGPTPHKEG